MQKNRLTATEPEQEITHPYDKDPEKLQLIASYDVLHLMNDNRVTLEKVEKLYDDSPKKLELIARYDVRHLMKDNGVTLEKVEKLYADSPEKLELIARYDVRHLMKDNDVTLEKVEKLYDDSPKKLELIARYDVRHLMKDNDVTLEKVEKLYDDSPEKLELIASDDVRHLMNDSGVTLEKINTLCDNLFPILQNIFIEKIPTCFNENIGGHDIVLLCKTYDGLLDGSEFNYDDVIAELISDNSIFKEVKTLNNGLSPDLLAIAHRIIGGYIKKDSDIILAEIKNLITAHDTMPDQKLALTLDKIMGKLISKNVIAFNEMKDLYGQLPDRLMAVVDISIERMNKVFFHLPKIEDYKDSSLKKEDREEAMSLTLVNKLSTKTETEPSDKQKDLLETFTDRITNDFIAKNENVFDAVRTLYGDRPDRLKAIVDGIIANSNIMHQQQLEGSNTGSNEYNNRHRMFSEHHNNKNDVREKNENPNITNTGPTDGY